MTVYLLPARFAWGRSTTIADLYQKCNNFTSFQKIVTAGVTISRRFRELLQLA